MSKPTRLAAMSLHMTSAAVAPLLAMDQQVQLSKEVFAGITTKNFGAHKPKIVSAVKIALDGKLRRGVTVDAAVSGVQLALDALEDLQKGADDELPPEREEEMEAPMIAPPPPPEATPPEEKKVFDAEPLKAFLASKGMGAEDIAKVCDMLPKPGLDTDPMAPNEGVTPMQPGAINPVGAKDMVSKPAMDEAIKSAVAEARKAEQGVRVALSEVKPWVGDLPSSMAFDSAADVYRHALVMRNVTGAKTMHADALLPVLQSLPKAGQKPERRTDPVLATDSSARGKAVALAPGLAGIQQV